MIQHIIGIHNPNQTNIIKINPLASIWVPTKTSISLFLKLSIIFRNQIYLELYPDPSSQFFALGKIVTSSCSICSVPKPFVVKSTLEQASMRGFSHGKSAIMTTQLIFMFMIR
jgi:hypothetical protein